MQLGGVEQRRVDVAGAQRQRQLGAAEHHAFSAARDLTRDDLAQQLARARRDDAAAQLVENHPVHRVAVIGFGHDALDAAPRQALDVERLLHRVARAQQRDAATAGALDRVGGRVDDVQQRQRYRGGDRVGNTVHRVGADQHAIGSAALQAPRAVGQLFAQPVPVAGALALHDVFEIDAEQQQPRRVQAAEPLGDRAVDDAVVQRGRFPAHAPDQSDGLHRVDSSLVDAEILFSVAVLLRIVSNVI
ncbi:hypothetical protein GALL_367660 [mine drainage metagenome]|uniref:Uncharacterized protein n=1 Tax=mine drainage metagenome TaxID=410659 RepID=A0A1J5QE34_9ZZZZ